MSRPNWRRSYLYQGILLRYDPPLSARERRIIREQLVAVSMETTGDCVTLRHPTFCFNKLLQMAFAWGRSRLGVSYWYGVHNGSIRPYKPRDL